MDRQARNALYGTLCGAVAVVLGTVALVGAALTANYLTGALGGFDIIVGGMSLFVIARSA